MSHFLLIIHFATCTCILHISYIAFCVCSSVVTFYLYFPSLPLYPFLPTLLSFTDHSCEYGDLAGRFENLKEDGFLRVTDTTGQLKLKDIIGRSVVIHKEGTNEILTCGTIVEKPGEF